MQHENLIINYSMFYDLTDNVVKPQSSTYADLVELLTSHPTVDKEKAFLPALNAWRYKDLDDPTVDNGKHNDGTPVRKFSSMGVRRLQGNLIEMSMFILDFDGAMHLDEVQAAFGLYDFICYTSLNHQVKDEQFNAQPLDKFRIVFPFVTPMPVQKFRELKHAMRYWLEGDGAPIADDKTFSINQIYLLPAVREENKVLARAWRNEGELMNWKMFEQFKKPALASPNYSKAVAGNNPTGRRLKADDMLRTANGSILVRDITSKISGVYCPFHDDRFPSEFAGITSGLTPYLQCKKCGRFYMDRSKPDSIIESLAKMKEKKLNREAK